MNGESERKKDDDVEEEEKPKSPAQEENNDHPASSPIRWTSHLKQCVFLSAHWLSNWSDNAYVSSSHVQYTGNHDLMYFLCRRSPDSPAEQQTNTYEEADNSISAEMEPSPVESWKDP